jgi:hypothetical protein
LPKAPWQTFYKHFTVDKSIKSALDKLDLIKLEIEKFELLIQGLLLKMVQACIFDTTLLYSSKNIFKDSSEQAKTKLD